MMDIAWLAQHGPCKKFEKGETIPCPGGVSADSESAMYILLGGRVDMADPMDKASPLVSFFPGSVFGGAEFFSEKSGNVYTAAADSVVYLITKASFAELSWSQPEILFEVLKAAYVPQESTAVGDAVPASAQTQTDTEAKAAFEAALDQSDAAAADPAVATGEDSPLERAIPLQDAIFPDGHKSYPGITKPNYAQLVYDKDYTCPFCKKNFSSYRIFSSKLHEAAPMRYDLRRFYTDFQSEWYDIITCRHCYFSTVHSYYTGSRPLMKQKIENELTAIKSTIHLDFDAPRDIDYVFTTHYLALICAEGYLSHAYPLRAKIWGNLSWLYEDVGDKEMELFAAEKAASAYEEVFTVTQMTPVQEQTTCLSIAGMQIRAGIDRDLRKYLFQVKTNRMGDRTYINMAEDIMDQLKVDS